MRWKDSRNNYATKSRGNDQSHIFDSRKSLMYQTKLTSQGFVLFIVLVFLQIFSLLGLMLLQKNILHKKSAANVWEKNLMRANAEVVLAQAEKTLLHSFPPCMIIATSPTKIIHANIAWWRGASCAGNFKRFKYYYVIAKLGVDNCSFIKNPKNGDINVAYFYQLFLLMQTEMDNKPRILLESVFIRKGERQVTCRSNPSTVQEGRQEWQELA